jgi:hypothetical protein
MLLRFREETVEDVAVNTLHRPGCGELDGAADLDSHPAGSSVRRDVAPRECWSCQPTVELVLGA